MGVKERLADQALLDHGVSEGEQKHRRPSFPGAAGDLANDDRTSPVHRGYDKPDRQSVDRYVAEQELRDERRKEKETECRGDAAKHISSVPPACSDIRPAG